MKRLLLILLFPALSWGATDFITSGDLPYTANIANCTLYVTGTSMTTTGSGISVTANNVRLVGDYDSLLFGTSAGDNAVGLSISGNNFIAENLWIIHAYATLDSLDHPSKDTLTNGARCVQMGASRNTILLDNVNCKVGGDNAICINIGSSPEARLTYGFEVDGGHLWNYCRRYTDRQYYMGAVMSLAALGGNDSTYGAYVHGVRIWTGPGQGIVFPGGWNSNPPNGRGIADYCTVTVDHRNDFYLVNQGESHPIGASSENAYSIFWTNCGPPSRGKHNYIRSGDTHGGSRGIMWESVQGKADRYCDLDSNDVVIHEGGNIRVGEAQGSNCLRIRDLELGKIRYCNIRGNTFIAIGDSLTTTSYGYRPNGAKIGYQSQSVPGYVNIENNLFKAYARSDTTDPGPVESRGLEFDSWEADTTFYFRNNKILSDGQIIYFLNNAYGTVDVDTLGSVSPLIDLRTFDSGYGTEAYSLSPVMLDCIYQGSAKDTSMFFASGGTQEMTLRRTLNIHVLGSDDIPVYGASVTATNAYSQDISLGLTDSFGLASDAVNYWFESRSETDSTGFNNFTLTAIYSGDTATASFAVAWNAFTDTLQLTATLGNGSEPPADTTAPVISGRTITSISTTGAVVGWTTNETTAGGADSVYVEATAQAATSGTSHDATLSGLSASTPYNLTFMSKDAAGNRATSDTSFTTSAESPAPSGGGNFIMMLK